MDKQLTAMARIARNLEPLTWAEKVQTIRFLFDKFLGPYAEVPASPSPAPEAPVPSHG